MAATDLSQRIALIRDFNRFYTRRIGVLREGLLRTPYSLAESRILFEIANRREPTAADLCRALDMDAGYLSRLLQGLERQGLVSRERSAEDGRRRLLTLTEEGRKAYGILNLRARDEVQAMVGDLPEEDQRSLIASMESIHRVLGGEAAPSEPFTLRTHEPGDMGWVVHRHGVLYWEEYGWDERFEALVARIVADFADRFDRRTDRCWIAERGGRRAGSVFVVRDGEDRTVARLRLLLVEPGFRGHGLGGRLVEECLRFARSAGYRKITLWTNSVLEAARHIYGKAGFKVLKREKHHSWGHDLTGEYWELPLA